MRSLSGKKKTKKDKKKATASQDLLKCPHLSNVQLCRGGGVGPAAGNADARGATMMCNDVQVADDVQVVDDVRGWLSISN